MNEAIVKNGIVENIIVGHVAGSVPCPADCAIGWTYDGANFAAPIPALADAKSAKIAEIISARNAACEADVTAHSRQWQADKRSQELLNSAITLAASGLPLPTSWRDVANSDMPISSISDLLAIAGAIAVQTQTAYATSWVKKSQVAAAVTVADVQAVMW